MRYSISKCRTIIVVALVVFFGKSDYDFSLNKEIDRRRMTFLEAVGIEETKVVPCDKHPKDSSNSG